MDRTSNKRMWCKVIVAIIVIVVCVSAVIALFFLNKNAEINPYSFSETRIASLSGLHEENINTVLDSLYVENDIICGFASNSGMSTDLYIANSVVSLAQLIPEYDMEVLTEKLFFLTGANIKKFDFLNLTYYVNICNILDLNIDYSAINDELSKYYDKNMNLFYIDSVEDSINIKIVATAIVKKAMKDNLSAELFAVEKGIEQAFNTYDFFMKEDVTLYNSGGDILYCISVFNMNHIVDRRKLTDWFEYWEAKYITANMDSSIDALQYSEYVNIAKVFQPDYSVEKLQNYYYGMSEESINKIDDLYVLYNILKNIESLDNAEVNKLFINKISNIINKESFVSLNIDVKSTAYGIMLSQKTGYSFNEDKVKKYIEKNYERDVSVETNYEKTYSLYYNLILDQLINGYYQDYDVKYFQTQIDELLKEIDYSPQSIVADIISTRRLVEIISDLQIFDADIKLTISQKNKIKKGLERALKENEIKNSVIFTDIFIVNKILSLDVVSDEQLIDVYNYLTTDGGTKATIEEGIIPDITSTFQFFSVLDMLNNYEYLEMQKKFIQMLEKNESIYVFDENDIDVDLSVIVYGNAIYSFELGGDKNDTIK